MGRHRSRNDCRIVADRSAIGTPDRAIHDTSFSNASKWARFRKLSWHERWLLTQALVLLPLTFLGLRVFGFNAVYSFLSRWTNRRGDAQTGQAAWPTARSTAAMVSIAARYGIKRANCLPQSLTLWWLLRRQGIAGELRVGVRKEVDSFEAHAWVEYNGLPVNDRPDVHQRYAAFDGAILPAGVVLR